MPATLDRFLKQRLMSFDVKTVKIKHHGRDMANSVKHHNVIQRLIFNHDSIDGLC